ncbi:MAG TPA: hypothetical protein VKB93_13920 [Thermoanaerobaculia bacterium]|nr:hypothetical protein [Thermoanaerobaculia bacterium]
MPYVEYGGASKKGAKKPVAYVEFTDSTSTKKGSKKPVPNVEFPPKKKKK